MVFLVYNDDNDDQFTKLSEATVKLSTKGRYATRAMIDLAAHSGEGLVLIKDISMRTNVTERYLEQLFIPLRAAGLVRATRGIRGGFALAKDPSIIKLSEIIQVMEGSVAPTECVDDASVCPRASSCVTRSVWIEMKEAMCGILEGTTLEDMVQRQNEGDREAATSYQI